MDGKTVIQEPRKRIMVRRIIESAPYIMYRYAEDFGIMDAFIPAMSGFTSMREAARRIVVLAAMDMLGSTGSIEMHTGIREGAVKENRDLVDFIGSESPHIAAVLKKAISKRIVKEFGSSGIVYDLRNKKSTKALTVRIAGTRITVEMNITVRTAVIGVLECFEIFEKNRLIS